jgi:hypothetical protein
MWFRRHSWGKNVCGLLGMAGSTLSPCDKTPWSSAAGASCFVRSSRVINISEPVVPESGTGTAPSGHLAIGDERAAAAMVAATLWRGLVTAHSRWWTRVLPVLAAHRLVPGPDGFAVQDLEAFAQHRGGQSSTEQTGHLGRGRRWRATVSVRYTAATAFGVGLSGTHGYGSTEDETLAIAVAGRIRHSARRS